MVILNYTSIIDYLVPNNVKAEIITRFAVNNIKFDRSVETTRQKRVFQRKRVSMTYDTRKLFSFFFDSFAAFV